MRREIRQLTEEDRKAFFHALETIYRLPTAVGNTIYGDEYRVRDVLGAVCMGVVLDVGILSGGMGLAGMGSNEDHEG